MRALCHDLLEHGACCFGTVVLKCVSVVCVAMFSDIRQLHEQQTQSLELPSPVGFYGPCVGTLCVGVPDFVPGLGPYDSFGTHPTQDGGKPLTGGSATGYASARPLEQLWAFRTAPDLRCLSATQVPGGNLVS